MKKGVTLVEILVAVVIFVTTIIAILMSFINCVFLNQLNREHVRATTHAQYVLEEINEANTNVAVIGGLILGGGWDWNTANIVAIPELSALDSENIATDATWDVAGELLNVTVTVNWDDLRGRPSNVVLRSLFAG
ncbi:MAG: hypothetical protein NG737_07720 [Omnitrophica bacterium]|nr:hypothetical protein [Candidatus Omnitrophota bacterium]